MKTLILGVAILMTGFIGFAILCSATVASNFTLNGSNNYMAIWRLFGVTPIAAGFLIMGIVGIVIAVIGVFQKSK